MEIYFLMHDVENKNLFCIMMFGLEKSDSDVFFTNLRILKSRNMIFILY